MSTQGEISFEDLVLKNDEHLADEGITFTQEDFGKTEEEIEVKKDDIIPEVKKEEEVIEKKEDTVVVPTLRVENDYTGIARKLLDKGDWKDFIIEGEDGKETKFSDLENLDEETFLTIWNEQKNLDKEELGKNYIAVKDIDENRLSLIKIIKEGGDLKEIFKDESQIQRPYENIDLNVQQNQQNILYQQYLNQGLSADDAKELVIKSTKDLSLSAKTEQIVKFYQEAYDENLKKIEKQVTEDKIKEAESIKEYKKNLITLYKQDELEDSLSKVLAESATKKTSDGQLYIDTVYDEMMKDPEKAKELVFFMLEKDKYLAKKGASIKRDVQISNMKKIKLVQDTNKVVAKEKEEESKTPFGDIVLE